MTPSDEILTIANLILKAQQSADAARQWITHRDWIDHAAGAERYARQAFSLGREAAKLWYGLENDTILRYVSTPPVVRFLESKEKW